MASKDWCGKAYDSRAPLETSRYPGRCIGVRASAPFEHQGLGRQYVTIEAEGIDLNWTHGWVMNVPAGEWRECAMVATADVIKSLDAAIAELQGHRDRLAAELAELERPRLVGV